MIDIKQPLRFFTAEEYRLRNKQILKQWNSMPSLIVSRTSLINFIIYRVKETPTQAESQDEIAITEIKTYKHDPNTDTYVLHSDITENLSITYGVRGIGNDLSNDYALYKGGSTISALPQGRYYLYIKDEEDNEFYSDDFIIRFTDYSVKFEYRNTLNINDLWFYNDFYWSVQFESITYSLNEFDEFVATLLDEDQHEVKTFQRKDEIFAVDVFGDSKAYGAIQAMEFCDDIYITTELGQKRQISITGIEVDDFTQGDHSQFKIKFRYIDDMLLSTAKGITWIKDYEGTDPVEVNEGIFRGDKRIVRGTKRIYRS